MEREWDLRISPVFLLPETASDGTSEADRIKQEWEARVNTPEPPSPASDSIKPEQLIPDLENVHQVSLPSPDPPTLRKASSRTDLAIAKPPPARALPPLPLDPESIPLPASPIEEALSVRSLEISPRIIPLPLSPSPPSSPRTVESPLSEGAEAEFSSPRPNLSLSFAPPVGSLVASPSTYECSEDGALAPPKPRSRSRPAPATSSDSDDASIATPSLDHSEFTLESPSTSYHPIHKPKPNALVKTWANEPTVPVIVESPIEENGVVMPTDALPEDDSNLPPLPPPRRRTQSGGLKKHKSLLGSFRRSVVETLSRGGNSPSARKTTFDISHLPPSPTVPTSTSFASQLVSSKSTPTYLTTQSLPRGRTDRISSVGLPRQPLSPTIHSNGSILLQTNHIEDEESRRMTEMAFM